MNQRLTKTTPLCTHHTLVHNQCNPYVNKLGWPACVLGCKTVYFDHLYNIILPTHRPRHVSALPRRTAHEVLYPRSTRTRPKCQQHPSSLQPTSPDAAHRCHPHRCCSHRCCCPHRCCCLHHCCGDEDWRRRWLWVWRDEAAATVQLVMAEAVLAALGPDDEDVVEVVGG